MKAKGSSAVNQVENGDTDNKENRQAIVHLLISESVAKGHLLRQESTVVKDGLDDFHGHRNHIDEKLHGRSKSRINIVFGIHEVANTGKTTYRNALNSDHIHGSHSVSELLRSSNLSLAGNNFSGPAPNSISEMSSIKSLDLSRHALSGALPQSLTKLDSLVSLNVSHNGFTEKFPEVLDLSYNQLNGELPGFDFVYDLQILKLSNNRFSGFIPSGLLKGDSLVLTELDLSANNLSGPLSIITSTTLHFLNISSNGFTGQLLPLTGSCAVLDLSNNKFEGNLMRVFKWGNIEYLDLSQIRLTGNIPR
ncbi:hypothetical protein KIW84_013121 [Lathyrus oleraceus]|uniref:Uncharacterized protein n=1 Tax=Pisum sativum TaxID=3888 RepID=A0A9D5GXN9_PEA|nr:hypothetical protein KIW84_013121 [Pisum sativum]